MIPAQQEAELFLCRVLLGFFGRPWPQPVAYGLMVLFRQSLNRRQLLHEPARPGLDGQGCSLTGPQPLPAGRRRSWPRCRYRRSAGDRRHLAVLLRCHLVQPRPQASTRRRRHYQAPAHTPAQGTPANFLMTRVSTTTASLEGAGDVGTGLLQVVGARVSRCRVFRV